MRYSNKLITPSPPSLQIMHAAFRGMLFEAPPPRIQYHGHFTAPRASQEAGMAITLSEDAEGSMVGLIKAEARCHFESRL